MMKLKVLVAAIALLGATTAANAVNFAWFTLENAPAGVTATSGPGQTLVINKGPNVTLVTLTIGYNVSNPTALAGWHIDLGSTDPGLTAGALTWLGTGFGSNEGALVNAGGALISNFGQSSIAVTGSTGLVGTFDLTVNKAPGTTGPRNITGTFGAGAQADGNGAWAGYVGANPNPTLGTPQYGFNGYDFTYTPGVGYAGTRPSLPVIEINNIPEPATLALLGLGVVCLIRRRKA